VLFVSMAVPYLHLLLARRRRAGRRAGGVE
jgi:hypothetical protein